MEVTFQVLLRQQQVQLLEECYLHLQYLLLVVVVG